MIPSNKRCSFGWKKKTGENFSRDVSNKFENNSAQGEEIILEDGEIDWLNLMPSKKT